MFMSKILLLMSLIILGCNIATAKTIIKIATISPKHSVWMNLMQVGADNIYRRTNGRVKVKFYPGGAMGSDKTVLRKIRVKQLHGAAMSSGSLLSVYSDNIVYNLPAKFNSIEQMYYVRAQFG